MVRDGSVSAVELVDAHLARIERFDPQLNALRVVFAERSRAEAKNADARRGAGEERPLLGVPVAVKDNVDVAGEISAHGSAAYGDRAVADAEIVRRLRAAGAIVIGKTHMPELAIFPFTESAAFGVTENPWRRGRSPGGSSGGSASAVAAGLAAAATASDGGGSIRIPAACCGLFGLKPQRGRVSLAPLSEHWYGLSAQGFVTRSVLDTALMLDVAAGPVAGDADRPQPLSAPFAESARTPPARLRIALSFKPSTYARVDARVRAGVEAVAEVLRGLGHTVEERDPDYGVIEPLFLPRWLRGIYDDAAAMAHPKRLERRTRTLARTGRIIPPALVARSRADEAALARRLRPLFEDADVLLTPVTPAPPNPTGRFEGRSTAVTTGGASMTVPFTIPWNVTGQPAASVPSPLDDGGVPLAAQIVGRPGDEPTLISLAAQIEAETAFSDRHPALDASAGFV